MKNDAKKLMILIYFMSQLKEIGVLLISIPEITNKGKEAAELEIKRGVKLTREEIFYFLIKFIDKDEEGRNVATVCTFISIIQDKGFNELKKILKICD